MEIRSWRVTVEALEMAELFLELINHGGSTPTLGLREGGSCSSLPPLAISMSSMTSWPYRRANLNGVQPL